MRDSETENTVDHRGSVLVSGCYSVVLALDIHKHPVAFLRYLPQKGEILRYADDWFYEKTPQHFATRSFIERHSDFDAETLDDVMDDITYQFQEACPIEELLTDLIEKGVKCKDRESSAALMMLLTDQENNTRSWPNRGNTPVELMHSPAKAKGIDRNAPCPCGSGKKYKDCCGNVIDLFSAR